MKLLLDTCVLLRALCEPEKLTARITDALNDENNLILVSSVSAWEIAIKRTLGKVNFDLPYSISHYCDQYYYEQLPIQFNHTELTERLPKIHRDPFDRMLAAQAQCEDAILVTQDKKLSQYDINILN